MLNGVSFTNANNGTAVGDSGIILRTTNAGFTWTRQSGGTSDHLWGVSFSDSSRGTAVGDGGTILHTNDGGANWTQQPNSTTDALLAVSFAGANNGMAVGAEGRILRTVYGDVLPFEELQDEYKVTHFNERDTIMTMIVLRSGERDNGRVLFASDSVLVQWQSKTSYHSNTLNVFGKPLHFSEIDKITVVNEGNFWNRLAAGSVGGLTLGLIVGGVISSTIDSTDQPRRLRAFLWGGLIGLIPGALVGAITGAIRDIDDTYAIEGKAVSYQAILPKLRQIAIFPAQPPPELEAFMKNKRSH